MPMINIIVLTQTPRTSNLNKYRLYSKILRIPLKTFQLNMARSFDAGASGRREEGAGESEGDVPAGPGETERVHQSCGERKGTPGTPEEDQEKDY